MHLGARVNQSACQGGAVGDRHNPLPHQDSYQSGGVAIGMLTASRRTSAISILSISSFADGAFTCCRW